MKASLKWLKEFVDFSLTPKEIADTLTMAGLEVEGMEEFEDDTILEINVTPNRADCLSIKGVAREISAILGLPLKEPSIPVFEKEREHLTVEIKEPQLCRRYAGRIIRDVKIAPPPQWLSRHLELHGIRSLNNIVDITNYVLLEMGQPLHAFDMDKLRGSHIVIKKAHPVNKFLTLDNEERILSKDMLLIWDRDVPIAIAGVMGGLNTEVTSSTVNILLESAYFHPISIRRTSRALNLSTESSYRFERGTDIEGIMLALNRATQMILEIAGGDVTATADNYLEPFEPLPISIKFKKINDILGIDIEPSLIEELLRRLGFEVRREGEGIVVIPPSFRQDIQRDIDVIEEIGRLYGYDKIPPTLPAVRIQPHTEDTKRNLIKTIRNSMRSAGYSEVINYSFLNPSVLDKLRLSPDDPRRNVVKIRNPLKKEEDALRTTLIPAILDNVVLNIRRGERSVRLFELSRVFLPSAQGLPKEPLQMAAVYLKEREPSLWHSRHEGFYDLKGTLENIFLELRIKDYSFLATELQEPYLHPGKSCAIKINNQIVGSLGTLHPAVMEALDIKGDISLFGLDIDRLFLNIPSGLTYTPLPKHPYVERDISIIVSQDTPAGDVRATILSIDSQMIESVNLFDVYTGAPIPEGKKSLAFSIRYRAGDRTLTNFEVNAMHSRIIKALEDSLKAELRT